MPETKSQDFSQPRNVNSLAMALSDSVMDMMPPWDEIPAEFKRMNNPFAKLQSEWFFHGLDSDRLTAKPGIDKDTALDHLAAIQRSFRPPHEHKAAGVAYLMSLWFEAPAIGGSERHGA